MFIGLDYVRVKV